MKMGKLNFGEGIVVIVGIGLAVFFLNNEVVMTENKQIKNNASSNISLEENVLPPGGVVIPVEWGSLGKQMIETGVISKDKFMAIYKNRGGLDQEGEDFLFGEKNGNMKINHQNSGLILNLFWAFGLANKNPILDDGPMKDSKYGGDAGVFASTGGWTLAEGDAMNHYSNHSFIVLTEEQQELVERVSKNIYRPCCGNSTYFPDCNHGMAMLGILELMASQGADEEEIYKTALQVNSYWFPDTYITIAEYFELQGVSWVEINPKEILGSEYSSASGYSRILEELQPSGSRGGAGCSI